MTFIQELLISSLFRLRPAFLASFLKRIIFPERKTCKTPHGEFWIDVASNIGFNLLKKGMYEPSMIEIIQSYLYPGSVIVDLGANEGYFSVIAAKLVGDSGRVVAVEPQSRLQSVINKNLDLNHCSNTEVLQTVVSDKREKMMLHLSPDMNSGSTSLMQTTRYPLQKQEIAGLTLAEIFQEQGVTECDLLKVDIEGWEYEAIMGSRELFSNRRVKAIALEFHPHLLAQRGLSETTIVDFLVSCGYSLNPAFTNTVFILSSN